MTKFIIISQQGSGTNLLRSFLNSHKNIVAYDELFCNPSHNHDWEIYTEDKGTIKEYLNSKFGVGNKRAIGFDVKYNQINEEIIKYTKEFIVIHLHRDCVRTFFQAIIKEEQSFNLKQVKKHCNYVKDRRKFVNDNWKNVYDLYYEDMTRGREIKKLPLAVEVELLKKLNVQYSKLSLSNLYINKRLTKRF